MSSLHYQKDNSNKGNKGFYIALGVCLIAIGVAAWTTYDSVVEYANPSEESSSQSQAAEPTQQSVSGATAGPKTSRPESSPASSSKAEMSEPAESKVEEAPVSSREAPKPQEPQTAQTVAVPAVVTYSFPVGDKVTKNFSGENPIFSDTMRDWRVHSGTDFSAKNGDAVAAIAPGAVTESYQDPLWGNILVIEHDGGVTAYYCGLGDTLLVKKGDIVSSGQKIGSVTTIPCESTEIPHLHLEIKKDGEYIDPLSILE